MGERGGSWAPYVVHAAAAIGAIGVAAAANHYLRSCEGGRRRVVGIIPARYKSSRFEGKPLALIRGKPMIQVIAPFTSSSSNHPGNAVYQPLPNMPSLRRLLFSSFRFGVEMHSDDSLTQV